MKEEDGGKMEKEEDGGGREEEGCERRYGEERIRVFSITIKSIPL